MDAGLFLNPVAEDINQVAQLLSLFGEVSGLKVNLQKCAFYPIRCQPADVAPLLHALPITIASFPCQYLGLPLHHRKLSKFEIQPMIDKIAKRLPRWRGKLLSLADRLELVNSVLTAIPIHMLTVLQIGKWAFKKIDKIRRDFLWKSKADQARAICLVN